VRLNQFVRAAVAATTLALLIGLAAAPVAAGESGRATRWVDDDGKADSVHGCAGNGMAFDEIQLAIDSSDANDVVLVCPGTYREYVNIAGKSGLVLRAVEPWTATIEPPLGVTSAANPAGFSPAVINISSAGTVVRWLNIVVPSTGSCDYDLNGILVSSATDVVLRGNRISGGTDNPVACGLLDPIVYINQSSGLVGFNTLSRFNDTGIYIGSGSSVTAYQNSIRIFAAPEQCTATIRILCAPQASPAGAIGLTGIAVWEGSTATIRRNVLKEKPATGTNDSSIVGIRVNNSAARVSRNRIRGLTFGMSIEGVDTGSYRLNRISGGRDSGILMSLSTGVLLANNLVTGRGGSGMVIDTDSHDNALRENNFSGNDATDCVDDSGPANTWTDNLGDDSNPSGLCSPPAP
jgi:parallel beta-helix repeat protein